MPAIALGLARFHLQRRCLRVTDAEIKACYGEAVRRLTEFLGHSIHVGGKYEDAYGMRMSRYGVLRTRGHLAYEIHPEFRAAAAELVELIPPLIQRHIEAKLGIVPRLGCPETRLRLASDPAGFLDLLAKQMGANPIHFEIVSFAIIKVHLEKFACKVYRDTRTAAHDKGVDLSTNFGVVYQVKKMKLQTQSAADRIYQELKHNFDSERLQNGSVVLVIDDIEEEVRRYLVKLNVKSLRSSQLLALARGFHAPEDRQRVLRVVFEEFSRDYAGNAAA